VYEVGFGWSRYELEKVSAECEEQNTEPYIYEELDQMCRMFCVAEEVHLG